MLAATQPGSTGPFKLKFVFEKAKDKQLATFEQLFDTHPTFQRICEVLEKCHPELARVNYILKSGQTIIDKDTWRVVQQQLKPQRAFTVAVSCKNGQDKHLAAQVVLECYRNGVIMVSCV